MSKSVLYPLYMCTTLVFKARERAQIEGVWEEGADENIWNQERRCNRKLEGTT